MEMDSFKPFQPLTTIRMANPGVGITDEIIQSRSGFLDLGGVASASIHVLILALTGTLYLETSPSEEGPWLTVKSWTAPTDVTLSLLTYYVAEYKLARLVRWRFAQTDAAGVACFSMRFQ
jgi:hypothetical protein